jgi:hypothetical protein
MSKINIQHSYSDFFTNNLSERFKGYLILIGSLFSTFIKWVMLKICGWLLLVLGMIESILIILSVMIRVKIFDLGAIGISIRRIIWVGIGLVDRLIVEVMISCEVLPEIIYPRSSATEYQ